MKMLEEGWSMDEILRLTDQYVSKNIREVKGSTEFALYAKTLKPIFYRQASMEQDIMPDEISADQKMTQTAIRSLFSNADEYVPRHFYDPESRFKRRDPGLFKHMFIQPAGGRIEWMTLHPDDPDKLMVKPDGDGIWRTDDMGRTWDCVTDRIPNRFHRNEVEAYAIPVDPDDWNHFYAFPTNGNPVYQTTDGGQSWRQIEGATHKGFKRGYAFRDARGNLKFLGANPNYWNSKLWISQDTCKTWRQITMPADQMDVHPESGALGFWFQEFAFHPTDRDIVYVPTSRSILQTTDGGDTFQKLQFKVYNADSTVLRSDTTVFPLAATSPMFLEIDPNNPLNIWAALGVRNVNTTALYRSRDGGKTWITVHEPLAGIGSGTVFGNESPWGWLGGFGVNFADPNFIYGCSMSSAWSENGGTDFREFGWGNRMKGFYPDGALHHVACARHNADNHAIWSHKSGRVFRGSDAGILMKDKSVNNHEWTNISGNMGQMLFYHIGVSEFGPQMVMGNTQDVDAQFYRRGRWGHWQGYEGSTAFTNPYSGEEYHSGSRGGRTWMTGQTTSSWSKGFSKANVCTGDWFLLRESANPGGSYFGRICDFGRTTKELDPIDGAYVIDYALARNTKMGTLYVMTNKYEWYKSLDQGDTFTKMTRPSLNGKDLSFNRIAVNPDNDNEIYLGSRNQLYKTVDGGGTWSDITYDLPKNMDCNNLIYHEGSGDIYFVSHNNGIFLLENGVTSWKFWMRGVNVSGFSMATISYPTQEMVWADYGRGVWVADLQNPADRFFRNGFNLKEMSHVEGRRTIGIDTHWTIPETYTYRWYVNGVEQLNQKNRFLYGDNLKVGDDIRLTINMIESPDVQTQSATFIVRDTNSSTIDYSPKYAISSNGKGRVDLGYVDLFRDEFTIDFWVNARSSGVILANRQVNYAAAKGFNIRFDNGNLYFNYSPDHIFPQPNNEESIKQDDGVSAGQMGMNQWNHVAITHKQDSIIEIYINGEKRVASTRILQQYDLNNAIYLSLFADGYEMFPIDASLDQLRIFGKRMTAADIRRLMYGRGQAGRDNLLFAHDFNTPDHSSIRESFSQAEMKPRIEAEVSFVQMSVPLGFDLSSSGDVNPEGLELSSGNDTIAYVRLNKSAEKSVLFAKSYSDSLAYKANLDRKYHKVKEGVFYFECFDDWDNQDTITIRIPGAVTNSKGNVYVSDKNVLNPYWLEIAPYNIDTLSREYVIDLPIERINGKLFSLVEFNPAIKLGVDLGEGSTYRIYSEDSLSLDVFASLTNGLEEPLREYELRSDMSGGEFASPLYFVNGSAQTVFKLPKTVLSEFGSVTKVMLSGEDDKVIPYQLNIENKILPKSNQSHLQIRGGGALIGDGQRFSSINQSNKLTFATWVRIDSSLMLQGMRPLLLFRGGGKTLGIQLERGELRCHWNEESWSWGTSTGLRVSEDMIGEWIHVALSADPQGLTYYLNGKSFRLNRNLNPTGVHVGMFVGKNNSGDNSFIGAFDQTSVWSRTLSSEEILSLMYKSPKADKDLICYLSYNHRNSEDKVVDLIEGTELVYSGTTEIINQSQIPYGEKLKTIWFYPQVNTSSDLNLDLSLPDSYSSPYTVTHFDKLPFAMSVPLSSEYRPIEGSFYTFSFDKELAANVNADIRFRHKGIQQGDSLVLLTRKLGAYSSFVSTDMVVATSNDSVSFKMIAPEASQAIIFVKPVSNDSVVRLELSVKSPEVVLVGDESEIAFKISYLSGSSTSDIVLTVEEPYATLKKDTCTFGDSFEIENLIILNRQAMNKFAVNPVTIYARGTNSEPLQLSIEFEPVIHIRLKNDDGTNKLVLDKQSIDLEIESELLQGILREPVKFNTTSEISNSVMTSLGQLLSENSYSDYELIYHNTKRRPKDRGFNLIGNPFMTDINLTKSDNVSHTNLNRYIYTYNPYEMSYYPYDMMKYDETNRIPSMSAFLVQTVSSDALIQIHNKAKQKVLNKRNTTHIMLDAVDEIELRLMSDGKFADRIQIRLESDAANEAELGEDAMKLFSFDSKANQLYTIAGDEHLSIDCRAKGESGRVKIGSRLTTASNIEILVSSMRVTDGMKGFYMINTGTGESIPLSANQKVTLDRNTLESGKYAILYEYQTVSDEALNDNYGYYVTTDLNQVVVHNLSGNSHIAVYSLNGQLIRNEEVKTNLYSTRLDSGVYIIRVRENGQEYSSKFIVK
ncbi:MAG: LamG-like jellyroll fold domain-containing protein [Bacteroidales bacterium]